MELKPTRDRQTPQRKPILDGIGNRLSPDEYKNPWVTLARGISPKAPALGLPNPAARQRQRRWSSDTLGATPPRDGPHSLAAADVAVAKPPRTRKKRSRNPSATWLKR